MYKPTLVHIHACISPPKFAFETFETHGLMRGSRIAAFVKVYFLNIDLQIKFWLKINIGKTFISALRTLFLLTDLF